MDTDDELFSGLEESINHHKRLAKNSGSNDMSEINNHLSYETEDHQNDDHNHTNTIDSGIN